MKLKVKFTKLFLIIVAVTLGFFMYLLYTWFFAYSYRTYVTEDGTYIGEFKGTNFHGIGKFIAQTGIIYEGSWQNGEIEGYGIMTFSNGIKYEGEFNCGLYNGYGKITMDDGEVIEGIFKDGKLVDK